jgi:hypothetical protein
MARAYGQHPADLLGYDRETDPAGWLVAGAAAFAAGLGRIQAEAARIKPMGTVDVTRI